jgi:DnaK suppressor protein
VEFLFIVGYKLMNVGGNCRAMLTKKKLKYFRELLGERLEELLSEANKTVTGMTDHKENLPDPSDRASLESDRNFTLRIRDRERKLIGKIKDALDRIESGSYGICEECGEEISAERLTARPVTTLCIDCKKRQETEEKVKGL